ncbi:MAG: S8 family serine peptidase, partial [Bernardetiaceae bacterium]|nr:S8 family serine peptidase [Bernardetiaceae bacterium]
MTSTFRGFRWWLGSCCLVLLAGLEAAGQLPVGQPRNERSQPILAWGRPARRGELPGQAVAIADFLARPELAQAQTVAGSCHVLLHLPQPLSLAQQQALAQAGVTLGEYFRENCWWAQMAGQVNLAALRQANLHQVVLPGPGHKASPLLVANNLPASARTVPGQVDMLVVTPIQLPENQLHKEITQRGGELRFYHAGLGLAHVRAPEAQLAQVVASPWVRWAEPLPPDPELQDEPSRQAHQANVLGGTLGGLARNLTGQGVKIGVWDGGYFPGHLDLANRVEVVRPGSPNTAWMQHGTRVTGIMAGSGTRLPFARGIAPEAQVFFHGNISGQSVLLPANYAPYTMFEAVERQGIVITQNSYGPLPPTPYGNAARALDQIVNLHPQVFHTHAAGNYGSGFNSVVNVAKNLLAVGNADINGQIYFQSSRGPAMDGRLFPHVVATGVGVFGTDNPATFVYSPGTGTSFACPQAS